jgi:VWFA-related protein
MTRLLPARRLLITFAAVACLATPAAQGSRPQATFRGGTDVVALDVSVLDGRRHPVHGLTRADFTVLEDGRELPVVAVDEVVLPIATRARAPWTRDAPRDVSTNEPAEGRLLVIMFDHTIGSGRPAEAAREVANAAIDLLGEGDRAAVISTQHLTRPLDFTADKAALRRAVASPAIGASQAGNGPEDSQCFCGLCSLEMIRRVADSLAAVSTRQKTLLFIGGAVAVDVQPERGPGATDCSLHTRPATREMFRAAQMSNLVVDAIDPTPLLAPLTLTAAVTGAGMGPVSPTPPPSPTASHPSLQILAEATGGRAVFNSNRPADVVQDIFEESRSYYLVGFQASSAGSAPDDAHSIDVRVARRGVEVMTRRRYYAPSVSSTPGASVQSTSRPGGDLTRLVRQSLPGGALPLRLAVVPAGRREGSRDVSVAIDLGVAVNRSLSTRLRVLTSVFDPEGREIGSRTQAIDIPASAELTVSAMGQLDVLSRLDLRPGSYEIRVAAEDERSGRNGRVFRGVEVPDLQRLELSVSDLMFEVRPAPLSVADAAFDGLLPIRPTTLRTFGRDEPVRVVTRMFGSGRQLRSDVTARLVVVDDEGRRAVERARTITRDSFGSAGWADAVFELGDAGLPAGSYLVTVQVSVDGHSASASARMDIR